MPVNLAQYRGTVGSFNNRNIVPKITYSLLTCKFFRELNRNITFLVITLLCSITLILSLSSTLLKLNSFHTKIKTIYWSVLITFLILIVIMFIQFIWVHALLIRQSGDTEMNPGPKPNPCHSFSICHWNLNSLTAHNYLKVSLLRAYVAIRKFDVVCLSETYLDSSNLSDDDNFNLPGYNVVRADHPSNTKKGGVCIYFKNSLPLKVLDIQLLQECINFEIKIADKTCNFISLYRSPSQSKDEFESFADNLELNLDSLALRNPYLIVVLGDFNAQTKGWYSLGKTTYEGTRIDGITSQFGLEQLIHEPTHIIGERSSCIDLVFASQSNLVVESGVQSSLHQNCHHQIVFARSNLKVVSPPSYKREVWHFKKVNVDHIRRAINGFQWG